jgi:hypothetical protein
LTEVVVLPAIGESLLVGLKMMESLQHTLHQLILSCNELFNLWVCIVGIVGPVVDVASLAVAMVVPCVHHLRDFERETISFLGLDLNPYYMHRKM